MQDVHFRASSELKSLYVITPADLNDWIAVMQMTLCARCQHSGSSGHGLLRTCTARRKKFKLKSTPLRTYLFVTVIKIELAQYASTGTAGLFASAAVEGADIDREGGGGAMRGAEDEFFSPMSTV